MNNEHEQIHKTAYEKTMQEFKDSEAQDKNRYLIRETIKAIWINEDTGKIVEPQEFYNGKNEWQVTNKNLKPVKAIIEINGNKVKGNKWYVKYVGESKGTKCVPQGKPLVIINKNKI